jgi:hypothetical protein
MQPHTREGCRLGRPKDQRPRISLSSKEPIGPNQVFVKEGLVEPGPIGHRDTLNLNG